MLKKGDKVVMHSCIEAENPKNEGKIWTCRTDEQKLHPKHDFTVVWLEGFSGSFHTQYLQKINLTELKMFQESVFSIIQLAHLDGKENAADSALKRIENLIIDSWGNS